MQHAPRNCYTYRWAVSYFSGAILINVNTPPSDVPARRSRRFCWGGSTCTATSRDGAGCFCPARRSTADDVAAVRGELNIRRPDVVCNLLLNLTAFAESRNRNRRKAGWLRCSARCPVFVFGPAGLGQYSNNVRIAPLIRHGPCLSVDASSFGRESSLPFTVFIALVMHKKALLTTIATCCRVGAGVADIGQATQHVQYHEDSYGSCYLQAILF